MAVEEREKRRGTGERISEQGVQEMNIANQYFSCQLDNNEHLTLH